MSGNKIKEHMTDPVDAFTLKIVEKVHPFFYQLNFTPNMLTMTGIISRLASFYYLFNGSKVLFLIGQLIGYFFDVIDGFYARTYKMTSKFGDLLDHISDTINFGGKIYYLYCSKLFRKSPYFIALIVLTFVMWLGTLSYLGCREQNKEKSNDDEEETLSIFKSMCSDKRMIHVFKYMGPGVLQMYMIGLIMMF